MEAVTKRYSVVFVCLGNICRSTMAEIVMNNMLGGAWIALGMDGGRAGTHDYHIGDPPDHRTVTFQRAILQDPHTKVLDQDMPETHWSREDRGGNAHGTPY